MYTIEFFYVFISATTYGTDLTLSYFNGNPFLGPEFEKIEDGLAVSGEIILAFMSFLP